MASSRLLLCGLFAGGIGLASWAWIAAPFSAADDPSTLLAQRVVQGPFAHDIVERGELESSNNVTVACEVQSRASGSNGVKIIEIVPEGTAVKKGDFLIRFDDAAILAERTTQQIALSSAEAATAQSKNDLTAAVIARKEYEFGEFETEREKINGEVLVASENASRAIETVENSERLSRRGYLSKSRLRSDRFDLAKAQSDLKVAKTKLNALVEYTREKKLSELDAKVKTSEAKLKADEAKLSLEQKKLTLLDEQITKCLVKAPADGQVIYDHEQDNWRGAEYQIKQGAVIHEQRVVIRLPDPKKMQVKAKVAESRIDRIRAGMPAKIEIEGLPGVELVGKVTRVNEYPASENWFNSAVKEYATTVEVTNPPAGLRPGMTAKVAIRVETIADALQVPIQAVVEQEGKYYCCLRPRNAPLEPRQVRVGSTNEKFFVIKQGLSANDEVLLNPRNHLAAMNLEKLAPLGAEPASPVAAESHTRQASATIGKPGL